MFGQSSPRFDSIPVRKGGLVKAAHVLFTFKALLTVVAIKLDPEFAKIKQKVVNISPLIFIEQTFIRIDYYYNFTSADL